MEDRILSWNGLNCPPKRNIIFKWISKQNCKIVCLQETHINLKNQKLLKKENLGEQQIIMAGDFNGVVNPKNDRKSQQNKKQR